MDATGAVLSEPSASRRYRIRRDFDEVDRSDFRRLAFETIRDYFQHETSQIDADPNLRGRFVIQSPSSFLITYGVPWKGTVAQRVRIPPGKLSLQPVAIGADDGGNDIVRSTSVERVA